MMRNERPSGLMGRSVPRLEDAKLLRGAGRFVDDIDLPDVLHATFVRSPVAHGLLQRVDANKARAMPGIRAVLTYADLRPVLACDRIPLALPVPALRFHVDPCVLARQEVCYVGEPVALVVADSRQQAEDAAALVELDVRPLPAVLEPRAGLEPGAPRARLDCPDNLVAHWVVEYGDVERAFAGADAPDVRAFSHPQGWRTLDRGARRARALRRNRRVAHGLGQHADAAQDQAGPGRGPGSVGRARSRHRARCRRRLRSQEPILSRRAGGPGGRVAVGPPDQMDRGSPRMLHRHQSRARAGLGDRGRRSTAAAGCSRSAAICATTTAPRRRPACRCRRIRPRISSAHMSCRRTGSRSRSASPIWWRRRRRVAPDARRAPS